METCSCHVFNAPLPGYHWRPDRYFHRQVYTVRSPRPVRHLSLVYLLSRLSLQHIADGANLAEEVISTVRTAQAFGTQNILGGLYDIHVSKSLAVELKTAMWLGGGMGAFFFFMYAAYGLAFHFGTTLILQGHGKHCTLLPGASPLMVWI